MKKEIVITIKPDGQTEVEVEAVGFKGNECEKATRPFEEVLGNVETRKKKAEYYQKSQTKTKTQMKRGR